MKTVYIAQEGEYGKRHFFTSNEERQEWIEKNGQGKTINVGDTHIEDNQHWYRVIITEEPMYTYSDFHAMYVAAKDESEARRHGREYIRAWDLNETIRKIERVCY